MKKIKPKYFIILFKIFPVRVCCRSPIIPARPSYSAELMSLSYSGSLPRYISTIEILNIYTSQATY